MNQFPKAEGHLEYLNMSLNLSPTVFWEKYMADDAEFWFAKFYESRDEKGIKDSPWAAPTAEEQTYDIIAGTSL